MSYNPNRIDASLSDVIATTVDHEDDGLYGDTGYDWWHDYDDYDPEPEPDREAYYHGYEHLEYDLMAEPLPEDDDVHDPNEIVLPITGKIGRNSAFPGVLPPCPYGCCLDKRLRKRRRPKFNVKSKRKDHRA